MIYEYADWCYGAEDEDTDTVPYSLRYFFTEEDENASQDYVLQVPVGEERRQVFAGYPPRDVITRSAKYLYHGLFPLHKYKQHRFYYRHCLEDTPAFDHG